MFFLTQVTLIVSFSEHRIIHLIDLNPIESKVKLKVHPLPLELTQNLLTGRKMSRTTGSWTGHFMKALVYSGSPTQPIPKGLQKIRTLVCKMAGKSFILYSRQFILKNPENTWG